jgi:N-acetylmuramoyl-L-alanine amidase
MLHSIPELALALLLTAATALSASAQTPVPKPAVTSSAPSAQQSATPQNASAPASPAPQANAVPVIPRAGLNVVVIDPAHGGTDAGGRGTEGIRESDVVLEFAAQLRKSLEAQGFQVVQTREANDNPSFDDRSARANAQRGAVFVTLHIASTGVTGTARVYVSPEFAPTATTDTTGMIPWDRAQGPFVGLSHKLGDLVQLELAKRFKGSPTAAIVAPVRQLRTTAAPAIAVEISSVSVADRAELERMIPGVVDSITRGIVAFKPSYILPTFSPNASGGTQP